MMRYVGTGIFMARSFTRSGWHCRDESAGYLDDAATVCVISYDSWAITSDHDHDYDYEQEQE
jgi:hypothetical protein